MAGELGLRYQIALWYALRKAVTEAPELGVTSIGPKPGESTDVIRVTVNGRRCEVWMKMS